MTENPVFIQLPTSCRFYLRWPDRGFGRRLCALRSPAVLTHCKSLRPVTVGQSKHSNEWSCSNQQGGPPRAHTHTHTHNCWLTHLRRVSVRLRRQRSLAKTGDSEQRVWFVRDEKRGEERRSPAERRNGEWVFFGQSDERKRCLLLAVVCHYNGSKNRSKEESQIQFTYHFMSGICLFVPQCLQSPLLPLRLTMQCEEFYK